MTKKVFLLVAMVWVSVSSWALSDRQASEESYFLTDKMAYELYLTSYQYDDVYEINYDYFRSLGSVRRSYAYEITLRNQKLQAVLSFDQWQLYCANTYFFTPVTISGNSWVFSFYTRYPRGTFYLTNHVRPVYRGAYRESLGHYQARPKSIPHYTRPLPPHHPSVGARPQTPRPYDVAPRPANPQRRPTQPGYNRRENGAPQDNHINSQPAPNRPNGSNMSRPFNDKSQNSNHVSPPTQSSRKNSSGVTRRIGAARR